MRKIKCNDVIDRFTEFVKSAKWHKNFHRNIVRSPEKEAFRRIQSVRSGRQIEQRAFVCDRFIGPAGSGVQIKSTNFHNWKTSPSSSAQENKSDISSGGGGRNLS